VVSVLRARLGLREPFSDPAVEYFGLRNAVFALEDTFLEVISPVRSGTSAGRLLERRGGDCGYMVMIQVSDLPAARARAAAAGVREVFEVELPGMAEVHLHPADMHGAIVSISMPGTARSWRWGGPAWEERGSGVGLSVAGATIGVADPASVGERWHAVLGGAPGISFASDANEPGPVEFRLRGERAVEPFVLGGVRFRTEQREERVSADG
jgi:hypothetical protein